MRAAQVTAAQTWVLRYSARQPNPGSDGPVIGRRLGQDFAVDPLEPAPHQHVVDLAGGPLRRIRAAPHRTFPPRHQRRDRRTPEVEVAREDLRPSVPKLFAKIL